VTDPSYEDSPLVAILDYDTVGVECLEISPVDG
jgi:hypothetical protein